MGYESKCALHTEWSLLDVHLFAMSGNDTK